MTRTRLYSLGIVLWICGSAAVASPQSAEARYSGTGGLRAAAAAGADRYAITVRVGSPELIGVSKPGDSLPRPPRLPSPRFALIATLRTPGSVLAPNAICGVDELFKSGFESP